MICNIFFNSIPLALPYNILTMINVENFSNDQKCFFGHQCFEQISHPAECETLRRCWDHSLGTQSETFPIIDLDANCEGLRTETHLVIKKKIGRVGKKNWRALWFEGIIPINRNEYLFKRTCGFGEISHHSKTKSYKTVFWPKDWALGCLNSPLAARERWD